MLCASIFSASKFFFLGLPDLVQKLREDSLSKPINSLCSIDSPNSFQFKCFQIAKPLQSILKDYRMLSFHHSSDIFTQIWTSVINNVSKAKVTMTFAEVVIRIWDPVFKQCCELLELVKSKNIKMRYVDEYFKQFYVDMNTQLVYDNLYSLHSGIEACLGRGRPVSAWIRDSVDLMEQYWILCEQAKAASVVLDLKESLNLTGNFDIIEDVASKVAESMKDVTLGRIDGKVIKVTSFLKQITGKKLECLQTFSMCKNIVEWIRKETNG